MIPPRVPRPVRRQPALTRPDPGPLPTFYYDDYLGLWVDITDTPTSSTFALYEDEAKTKPAGSIVTTFPTGDTFPQIFTSHYTYTAGTQAGSHGDYNNTVNQDGSGSSSYLDVYVDGGKDQGSSQWTAGGDYTWTGRTDNADKSYSSMKGHVPCGWQRRDALGRLRWLRLRLHVPRRWFGQCAHLWPLPRPARHHSWDTQGNTTITLRGRHKRIHSRLGLWRCRSGRRLRQQWIGRGVFGNRYHRYGPHTAHQQIRAHKPLR